MERIEGDFSAPRGRIALLASRFNELVVARLIEGARDALLRHGVADEQLTLVRVPGAFELPLTADKLAASGRFEAIVALGCVIRGDTAHFDYVAGECARGLMRVMLESSVPVSFGVLTTDTVAQAEERADPARADKGGEAIATAITMARLLRRI